VAGREGADRTGVDQYLAPGQVLLDLVGREQRQDPPVGAEQLGPDPVAGAQAQEIVLVGGRQEPVVAAFGTDGGGPLAPNRGGAEGARAVGWVDGQLIGQRQEPLVQGPVGGPGQRLGQLRAGQVGAGHGADQQRPAAE
jgi:hypothetical protein